MQKEIKLTCSRDDDKNIRCAGCLKIIIPNNITNDDVIDEMISQFEKSGGVSNCCYDCEFSWFCNKCSFITIFKTSKWVTCGKTVMKQLLNSQHGGGRFSSDRDADYWIYLRKFFEQDMKYAKRRAHNLNGGVVDIETIKKIYSNKNPDKILASYKKYIKTCRSEMTSLENLYERLRAFEIPIDLT